jgi:hypothetical protein
MLSVRQLYGWCCPSCGEDDCSPITEAYEETSRLMCGECWAELCDESDDGQPGESQEWADFDPEC